MSDNNNESMTGKLAEAVAEPAKEATQTVTSEMKKVAREAAIVVLAPVVKKATTSIAKQAATRGPELFQEHIAPRIEDAGGIGNLAKQATGSSGLKGMAIGKAAESVIGKVTGGKGGGSADGTGRGRRLPVQESIDIGVPIDVAYNEWTQFEQFPEFMHRVERIEQIDDTHLVWHENIWGRRRQWKAEITDQTPNQRIAWRSEDGVENVGVITFHDIGDRLTRILVNMDFQPKGLMEKTASGFRMSRRALRSDLMRFKAHIEMKDEEDGAWRGTIEDGEVTDYDEDYENPRDSDDDRDAGDEEARDTSDEYEDDYDEDEPSDEYEEEDEDEDDVDEPSDEYEDEDEDDVDEPSDEYEDEEDEQPSDEYEDEDEDEEDEPSDEYEDEEEEQDEAPTSQVRRRRRQAEDQGRRGTDAAGKASSGARKATSAGRKAAASSPRKATSGARKTASSAQKGTSGARKKATSSPRKATAAASKATSGTRKTATSTPRKATSGARKTASSAQKGTSGARKTASSGARKATSGARKTASSGTRGARKATGSKSR